MKLNLQFIRIVNINYWNSSIKLSFIRFEMLCFDIHQILINILSNYYILNFVILSLIIINLYSIFSHI